MKSLAIISLVGALAGLACTAVNDDPTTELPGPGPEDEAADAGDLADAAADAASLPDATALCDTPLVAEMTVTFSEPFVLRDAAFAFDPVTQTCALQSGSTIASKALGLSQAATFHVTSGFDWKLTGSTDGTVASGGGSVDPLPTQTDVTLTLEHDSGEPRLQVTIAFDELSHTVSVSSVTAL